VVDRRSSPAEIEASDSKVLEVLTRESEHWRGLQPDPIDRLLIRRSPVRAQVGEQEVRAFRGKQRGEVEIVDVIRISPAMRVLLDR
jgi:hypothetical protein